jgi:hypothetical protein
LLPCAVAAFLGGTAPHVARAAAPAAEPSAWRDRIDWRDRWASVDRTLLDDGLARYRLRAGGAGEAARERGVAEMPDRPRLRTGNPLFDSLFALALEEAAEDSVAQIADAQFNDGRAIPCHCFETGAKWHYVWTRDVAYAIDLALAYLDPLRARNSLLFKQSGLRRTLLAAGSADAGLVAEDTGSGGSWPVSTDRVVWIHAAMDVLRALPPTDAQAFEPVLRRITADTLDQDREYAFDRRAGLYRGETSFLDWREQTYPAWTRDDTRYIAESFSLSTNVLHYVALRDAAELERRAGSPRAREFERSAADLRKRINDRFWQRESGLYASYLGPDLAPAAAHDLLGLALAVIHGVADERQARSIFARYPSTEAGPPVIWPQQPAIPIYHNRAIWPFVTAYALEAARRARDPAAMSTFAESLIRGAALALSNMENFEFRTQQTALDDGPLSGPVINSPRQLWSVAGYLGAVVNGLFGVTLAPDGIGIAPLLPGPLATRLFAGRAELVLEQLAVRGTTLTVRLRLPPQWSERDLLEAAAITVNGAPLAGARLQAPAGSSLEVVVELVARPAAPSIPVAADARPASSSERAARFAPPSPSLASVWRAAGVVQLTVNGVAPGGRWHVYRDGRWRASGTADRPFRDPAADPHRTACYVATQVAASGGPPSLPSREVCLEGADSRRHFTAASGALTAAGHPLVAVDGERLYADWGEPGERLELAYLPAASGLHRLALRYRNASGPVNTGITAAVKRVTVRCGTGRLAETGVIVMPHLPPQTFGESTGVVFDAHGGVRCGITIEDGFNMSYLEHFGLYTGGRGGREGPRNLADISAAQIDAIGRPRLGRD